MLILRQQYGTRALSGYYPFCISDVIAGIDIVMNKAFTTQEDGKTIVDGPRLSQVILHVNDNLIFIIINFRNFDAFASTTLVIILI